MIGWKFRKLEATFNGRHNHVKSLVFLFLYRTQGYMSLRTIIEYTECDYHSLAVLLSRWYRWDYILKRFDKGHKIYKYALAARGSKFVIERIPEQLKIELASKLDTIEQGIKDKHEEWLKDIDARYNAIMAKFEGKQVSKQPPDYPPNSF